MRLGYATETDAERLPPSAGRLIMITNASDPSVNNAVVTEFEQLWHEHGEENMQTFQFEEALGLPHDLITSTRPEAQIDLVYPKLLQLIQ